MNGSVKSKVLVLYVIIHYTQTEKVLNKILVVIFLKFSLFFNIRWKKFILKQNSVWQQNDILTYYKQPRQASSCDSKSPWSFQIQWQPLLF